MRHNRLALFVGVAGLLCVAALWVFSLLVERSVIRDAERRSLAWAEHAAFRLERVEALAAGAPAEPEDWQAIEEMARFGDVFRFKLFSVDGVLRFESDDASASGAGLGQHNPEAASVVETGEPYTVVADGRDKPNRPDLYSETYLPVVREGEVIAIMEIYLNQTATQAAVWTDYAVFGLAILLLSGLGFAGPTTALALVLRRLRAQNVELDEERQRAQAADRAKSEFLATMSHEIRTPMNGVLGMAQLLEGTALDARQRTLADVILQSGRQLLRVINDILDVSKIDAGRLALEPRAFKLSRIAHEPARLVAHLAEEKGLALAVRVDPALPRCVVGDPDRLQQVVTNLLGNAVKFTEAGQVYLNLAAVDGAAEGAGARCRLRVEVEDTGPGIPQDRRAQVFERFTQIDGGSTRLHEGTGLGLAICKGLVEAMGGRIGVEGATGGIPGAARARGATFWFEVDLPVAEAEPGEEARPRALPVHAAGRRVLSVDDRETNRFIVRELLQSWGLAEASAASGREAMQLLANAARRGEPFDAVILDHHMPGMSGPQVVEAIRRDPALAGTAVVLLSSVEDERGAAPFAADAHLTKPAAPSALFDALMAALARAAGSGAPEGPEAAARAPRSPSGLQPLPERLPEPLAEPARGVVLLVEDNRFNRVVVRQILAGLAVEVVEARDGTEALALAAECRPDVILMDVSMPGMDGLEATRRLRAREREEGRPRTPILGLTAHALPADRARCREAGMDDYLPKPIDIGRLRDAVADAVGRRAAAA